MKGLTFGAKARRKTMLRRWINVAWVLSMGAALAGIPGANLGVDTISRLAESPARRGYEASESTSGLIAFRRRVFELRPKPKPRPEPEPAIEIDIEALPQETTEGSIAGSDSLGSDSSTGDTSSSDTTSESLLSEPVDQPASSFAPSGSITGTIYDAAAQYGVDGSYLVSIAHCESSMNPQAVSSAGYYGLFQFDYATWNEYGYGSIYDPAAQAATAAELIAAGESDRWPNCA